MKKILFGLFFLVLFSGCAQKNHYGSYNQANRASEKAQMQLQRDVR